MGMHFDLRPMTPEERASGLVAVEWESEADDGSVVSALEDVGSVANRSYGATQNLECLRDDEMTVSSEVEGRVGKCERSCERLARDMKTVWTLERAFEGRMSEHVKGCRLVSLLAKKVSEFSTVLQDERVDVWADVTHIILHDIEELGV